MSEINYFRIESRDITKPIYRITLGDLIPEEERITFPTARKDRSGNIFPQNQNLSGSKAFLDYAINKDSLEILLVGIEPQFQSNGAKDLLIEEVGRCAKLNKLKEVIHYSTTIYSEKQIKKL